MPESREELLLRSCVPCRGGIPPLQISKVESMIKLVSGWTHLKNGIDKIQKTFKFKDFKKAMLFVNKVAELANEEDHHPDFLIHWNEVTLTFWTHAIDGLFENDFIMAAKVDELLKEKL